MSVCDTRHNTMRTTHHLGTIGMPTEEPTVQDQLYELLPEAFTNASTN